MDLSLLSKNLETLEAADDAAERLADILAMFTAANMEMVVYDAKLLQIDSAKCLEKCVEVIFDHAINSDSQSNFAILCTKLLFQSVPVNDESLKMITFKEQILEKSRREVQNFLEKQTLVKSGVRKNWQPSFEEDTPCLKILRRPIALFRFIGELHHVDFLPSTFLMQFLPAMLDDTFCNENTLETFCALLKIAGKKLEITEANDLSEPFKVLEDKKLSPSISPHTRFMIEEILEMRNNNWNPCSEVDWIKLYNLFLCDVEEKIYVLELWYGSNN